MKSDVKRKISGGSESGTCGWKFFPARRRAAEKSSGLHHALQDVEQDAAEGIVPGVRDHSWTQTFSEGRQDAGHQTETPDLHHARSAFVTVRGADDRGGEHDADEGAAGERDELPLQIAAEDDLLTEAGGGAQSQPENDFHGVRGGQEADLLQGLNLLRMSSESERVSHGGEHQGGADPEAGGHGQIEQYVLGRRPFSARDL